MANVANGHPVQEQTFIAKDQRSLFENEAGAQTQADSATVANGGDVRQSFGNIVGSQPGQEVGTDFTVAEDLHNRRQGPVGQD